MVFSFFHLIFRLFISIAYRQKLKHKKVPIILLTETFLLTEL
ncbi:hypothetical protein NCDO763_2274 [Lactococcus cremoris]|uniref:Uncharacterized protein n=1 Tax=Lactococcus lactis subsp. cremoris TaxID=1359 RepID=A0A166WVK0_LACLC|nr:hypothetical protein V4_1593 [Lactococcus cremoris]KZK08621.1 hypothetical protein AB996_0058 [Lactococcus cremoris]KZK10941.1 hypothetical protein AB995_1618 [Lactococcus cremoris]KZK35886.1 hypothetical protein N41_2014 [Lactococcus cremoris]KZK41090.1 hypothetical protein B40_2104 [Lactococcus cremoris]